jgi:hypothetical protein
MPDNIHTDDLVARRQEIIDEIEDAVNNTLPDIDTFHSLVDEFYEIAEIDSYCSDFNYGETLIHEDNFQDYIENLIDDVYPEISEVVNTTNWPVITIDYEQSANDAKMDYTEVEYLGENYYTR